jgi:hypothetical protein
MLKDSLTRNFWSERLVQSFDFQWFIEFEYKFHNTLKNVPIFLILVGIIFVLIQAFLAGGILEVLNSKSTKNLFIDFFYGCVRYFVRFLKVFLISIVCYAGLYYLNLIYIRYVDILTYNTESQLVVIIATTARYLLIAVLFGILNIIFDYVRIRIVVHQSYNTFEDIWLTFKFLIKNFIKVFSLFWFIAIVGLIIFLCYFFIDNIYNPTTFILIFIMFLIRQIYITGKIWVKLLFYSCQLELYREITAQVIPVEASEINVPSKGE